MLVLLADGVLDVRRDLEVRAAALAQPGPPAGPLAEDGLRARIARGLLGAGGDADFLTALERFDRARQSVLTPDETLEAHGEVEVELTRIARSGVGSTQRARAANLNGVLLVSDAELEPTSASRFLQLAREAFREAVRLDPANDEAKANLELLVALADRRRGELGVESGSEGSAGAGAGPVGSGY